jgi:class 3 adenylate cyclase/tetratricopeptide (TPR) repeat protein
MQAERLDTLTVLFTDLVDSTRLRTTLGERDAEDVRTRVEAVQADVVRSERGRIVKGLGDGVLAVFPAADHALRAAGRLAARLAALAERSDVRIDARVGVSAGDVRQTDDDVFGTPVIEAARLVAAADDGEILVADVVRALAGSWSQHPLRDRGPRTLKGLGAPVRCWTLDWRRLPPPPAPDTGLVVDDEFPFVGRRSELGVLEDAWRATRDGRQTAVLLGGEPGAGKTRIAVEMARRVMDDGGIVLAGRCERHATTPLEPVQHLTASYVTEVDRTTIAADAGVFAPELARHIAALGFLVEDPGPRDADRDAERFRLFMGLTNLVRSAARRTPVLLVIDDLQWADAMSAALLEHLLRVPDLGAVCVIATYRDVPTGGRQVSTGALERLPGVTALRLEGLPAPTLADLVSRSDSRLDAEQLWTRTRGHPFFAVELIRRARAGGADAGVPTSVRDLVTERTAHLRHDTTRLLTVGALVGHAFDLGLVARVADLDNAAALEAVEEAVAARLLLEVPGEPERFQFTHALIAETFATRPSAARVTRMHATIADVLRVDGAPETEVTAHMLRAAPLIGIDTAVTAARDATRTALTAGEPDQAAAVLEQALRVDLSARPQLRAELLIELGECLNHASRLAEAVPHFEEAARLAELEGRFDLLSRAALRCWGGNPWVDNADDTAPRLLRQALSRCPPSDENRRAALQAGLAAFSIFTARLADRDRITADAVARARVSGDPTLLATVLVARHVAITAPLAIDALDEVRRELGATAAAVPMAVAPGDLVGISSADFWRADGDAYRAAAASFDLSDPRLAAGDVTVGTQLAACVALLDGRTADARKLADHALDVGAWGDASVGNHGWQVLLADWLDGRIGDSRDRVVAAYERYGGQPLRLTLAWVEADTGAGRSARALLERVRRERLARLPELFLGTIALAAGAAAVATLDDRDWAAPFIDAIEPVRHLMSGVPWAPFPAGAFYSGMLHGVLGDVRTADDCFAQARELHERMRAPAYVALGDAAHGHMLLDHDRARADRLLASAEEFARDMGLGGILDLATGA